MYSSVLDSQFVSLFMKKYGDTIADAIPDPDLLQRSAVQSAHFTMGGGMDRFHLKSFFLNHSKKKKRFPVYFKRTFFTDPPLEFIGRVTRH